jgi:hypothetical protein
MKTDFSGIGEVPCLLTNGTIRAGYMYILRYLTDKTKRDKVNKIFQLEEGISLVSQMLISISKDEVGGRGL